MTDFAASCRIAVAGLPYHCCQHFMAFAFTRPTFAAEFGGECKCEWPCNGLDSQWMRTNCHYNTSAVYTQAIVHNDAAMMQIINAMMLHRCKCNDAVSLQFVFFFVENFEI